MKQILLFMLLLAFGLVACNKKKEAERIPVVNEVIEPVVIDTIAENIEEEVIEEPIYSEPAKPNKYFLISGSFIEPSNAQKYHKELVNQGFSSEIIERPEGPNGEFYKVSYMGFSSWNKTVEALRSERQIPGKDSVWLLVKN